jgi:hypothetical protein
LSRAEGRQCAARPSPPETSKPRPTGPPRHQKFLSPFAKGRHPRAGSRCGWEGWPVELTGGDVDRKGSRAPRTAGELLIGPRTWSGGAERRILGTVDDWLVGDSPRILSRLSGPGAACRPRQDRGRRLNSSQVEDAWISPLTNLQPPSASGGNMYAQRSHRIPGSGAGL